MATITYGHVETPVGRLLLTGRDGALTGLYFGDEGSTPEINPDWVRDEGGFEPVHSQLSEYFGGHRREFDLPLQMDGSPFQRKVWSALLDIPYGLTASYGEIARKVGSPGAARAVGAANGRNPIAIIVPCHRVIGADDTLTGYGGGLDRKAWLLDLERGFRHEGGDLLNRPAGLRARAVLRPSPVL